MPTLPTIQRRPLSGVVDMPRVSPESVPGYGIGKGLTELAETAQHIQNVYDNSEARRIVGETSEEVRGALELNALQINDPDEFRTKSQTALTEIKSRVGAIENPRIKALVNAHLADNFKGAERAIELGVFKKQKDRIRANFDKEKSTLIGEMASPDPEVATNAAKTLGARLGEMVGTGFMDNEEAQKQRQDAFNESMNLEARQNPTKFIADELQGKYKGRDSTAVQRALDIAQRIETARAQKDAKEAKAIEDEAERTYEVLASERRLDVNELKQSARFYGWSDEKVNGLIKMQIGLKAANPYESAAIEDALNPVDRKATYSRADVISAEKRLTELAKSGSVSTATPEYRAAIRRLQSMLDRLEVRGEIKERQSTFDARQAIEGLYKEYLPGNTSKGIVADKARRMREVTDLDPAQQRQYVDRFRAELETQRQQNQAPQINRGKLRSIQ